jgi:hypothetical protein
MIFVALGKLWQRKISVLACLDIGSHIIYKQALAITVYLMASAGKARFIQ